MRPQLRGISEMRSLFASLREFQSDKDKPCLRVTLAVVMVTFSVFSSPVSAAWIGAARPLMGTQVSVYLWHDDEAQGDAALEAVFTLWRVSEDSKYLEDAHERLRRLRDDSPEAYRESMLSGVPLHRDIMQAWNEQAGS